MTKLRSQFWIVKGRNFVKQILAKCYVCKKYKGRPYTAPLPPPLPSFRVQESPPFMYTGVDFAGPLYIKAARSSPCKVWLCLFTCCVTRAVHLDLVTDLSTPAFIRSLKRFTAQRGIPMKMFSNNARHSRPQPKYSSRLSNIMTCIVFWLAEAYSGTSTCPRLHGRGECLNDSYDQ